MKRHVIIVATAASAVALPATAAAHISLHPNTVPASANPTWDVRVPNEEDTANTTKVDMQIPPGFTDVTTQLPPGWTVQVLHRKLATPIQTDQGSVTQEVSEIIWSANKGGGIPPGGFQQFPILTAFPDNDSGQTLTFKVIQTYSNGDVVRWIEPPNSSGHPAPTVDITAKGGALQDIAGTEAGPGPAPSTSPTPRASKSSGATKGLGVTALVRAILGLAAGLLALLGARRRPGAVS